MTDIDANSLTVRNSQAQTMSVSLETVVLIEDVAEENNVLLGDDRLTCSADRTWATDEHLHSREHRTSLRRRTPFGMTL